MRDRAFVAVGEAQRRVRAALRTRGAGGRRGGGGGGARDELDGRRCRTCAARLRGADPDRRPLQDTSPRADRRVHDLHRASADEGPNRSAPQRARLTGPERRTVPHARADHEVRSHRAPSAREVDAYCDQPPPWLGCRAGKLGGRRQEPHAVRALDHPKSGRPSWQPAAERRARDPAAPALTTPALTAEPRVARGTPRDEDVPEPEDADRAVKRAVAQPDVWRADAPRQRVGQRLPAAPAAQPARQPVASQRPPARCARRAESPGLHVAEVMRHAVRDAERPVPAKGVAAHVAPLATVPTSGPPGHRLTCASSQAGVRCRACRARAAAPPPQPPAPR